MGRKSNSTGLIIGLIAMAMAGYVLVDNTIIPMIFPTTEPGIKNTWYANKTGTYGILIPVGSFTGDEEYLPPLSLEITVNSGENVYVLFTGYLKFNAGVSEAFLFIYIDDVDVSYHTRISRIDTSDIERFPFSIQWVDTSLLPGIHNVTARGYATAGGFTNIYSCILLVQTFI